MRQVALGLCRRELRLLRTRIEREQDLPLVDVRARNEADPIDDSRQVGG